MSGAAGIPVDAPRRVTARPGSDGALPHSAHGAEAPC